MGARARAGEHPAETGGRARGRGATKEGEGKQEKGAGPKGAWSQRPMRRAGRQGWGAAGCALCRGSADGQTDVRCPLECWGSEEGAGHVMSRFEGEIVGGNL